jgi:hypothetical protein
VTLRASWTVPGVEHHPALQDRATLQSGRGGHRGPAAGNVMTTVPLAEPTKRGTVWPTAHPSQPMMPAPKPSHHPAAPGSGCVFWLPKHMYPSLTATDLRGVSGPDKVQDLKAERLKLQNDARTTLLQGLAAVVVLIGAGIGASVTLRQCPRPATARRSDPRPPAAR